MGGAWHCLGAQGLLQPSYPGRQKQRLAISLVPARRLLHLQLPLHLNKGSAALHQEFCSPLWHQMFLCASFRHLRLNYLQKGASGLYYLTLHYFKKWLRRL